MAGEHTTVAIAEDLTMPLLGLGVWQAAEGAQTRRAVGWALEAGYRHRHRPGLRQRAQRRRGAPRLRRAPRARLPDHQVPAGQAGPRTRAGGQPGAARRRPGAVQPIPVPSRSVARWLTHAGATGSSSSLQSAHPRPRPGAPHHRRDRRPPAPDPSAGPAALGDPAVAQSLCAPETLRRPVGYANADARRSIQLLVLLARGDVAIRELPLAPLVVDAIRRQLPEPLHCHAIRSTSRGLPSPRSAPQQPCSARVRDEARWCDARRHAGSLLTTC
jgi:hypothetical protein